MRLLGLADLATPEEIKRAYRQLAKEIHPDKHGGDEGAREQFIAVGKAYRTLMRVARAVEHGKQVGLCAGCGGFTEVAIGPDGRPRCTRCALPGLGARLLPIPALVVVKGLSSLILLVAASGLLIAAIPTGNLLFSAGAVLAGLLGLAVLARACITIVYCVTKRDWAAVIGTGRGPPKRRA